MQSFKIFFNSLVCLFFIATLAACDTNTPQQTGTESAAISNISSSEQSTPSASNEQVNLQEKFTVLENPLTVTTGENIEVTELFWYGCGHCYALEPFVNSWLEDKPENSEFVKTPAVFSSSWAFHAKAYYTMEALGVLDQANDAFFHQIHVLHKPINDLNSLILFLENYDKSEQEVSAAFNSFAVDTKLRNATSITKQSSATGVPAVLVDGKYLTSVGQAGGQTELFDVIDELIYKAAAER